MSRVRQKLMGLPDAEEDWIAISVWDAEHT